MQQATAAPTMPPVPPAPGTPYVVRMHGSPQADYAAAVAQREVLGQQLGQLNRERAGLATQLRVWGTRDREGADRSGLEARITALDARIAARDRQIGQADERIAELAAVPGAVTGHQFEQRWVGRRDRGPSSDAFIAIPIVFFLCVLSPLSIAYARRVWRRGTPGPAAIPGDLAERMARLDQAVESIAIEVERIGEGQRFMTKVLTDGGRSLANVSDDGRSLANVSQR